MLVGTAGGAGGQGPRGPHLAVFTFPHPQAALEEELPRVLGGGAGDGGGQVQPQELPEQLQEPPGQRWAQVGA